MKYYKEFKEAHPETVGEKDHAFDMSNYIDWIDAKYIESKLKNHGDIGDVSERLSVKEIGKLADQFIKSRFERLDSEIWVDEIRYEREVFIAGANAVLNAR